MILDFVRQHLASKLGGWRRATSCHYNVMVYRAKCQMIDQIPLKELAKAEFEEEMVNNKDTVKLSDIVEGMSSETSKQGPNQTKSMV